MNLAYVIIPAKFESVSSLKLLLLLLPVEYQWQEVLFGHVKLLNELL